MIKKKELKDTAIKSNKSIDFIPSENKLKWKWKAVVLFFLLVLLLLFGI